MAISLHRRYILFLVDNKNKWKRLNTYGPKLVENIVQATARDCLEEAMVKVTRSGYDIVMHIHDELIKD